MKKPIELLKGAGRLWRNSADEVKVALVIVGTLAALPLGFLATEGRAIHNCNRGDQLEACRQVKEQSLITNQRYLAQLAAESQAESQRRAEEAEREQATARAAKEIERQLAAQGWWEPEPGILLRWCTAAQPCPESDSFSDYTWRAMVWCRDRACGDIYSRINIKDSTGVVLGWTNDTAYGDIGQKVVLTFGSSTPGSAEITEFIARPQG